MKQVGIVGWRGMVGSVLLQRMIEENDFDDISAHFFSTSSVGGVGPVINGKSDILKDANSLAPSPKWISSSPVRAGIIPKPSIQR